MSKSRPTGITVLGILYILGGIGALVGSAAVGIIAGSLAGNQLFGSLAAGIGGLIVFFLLIIAVIEFVIAGALFSGKSWGRTLVIILAIIDLLINLTTLVSGNVFAVIGIVLDLIVLYYMWRPHVIEYFKGYSAGMTKSW
ncbi:MAG: hypothetical protein QXJ74_08905 [Nitrososphaera sp.]